MFHTIPSRLLYAGSPLFVDLVEHHPKAESLFACLPQEASECVRKRLQSAVPRTKVADALLAYNRSIDAPKAATTGIEKLRDSDAVCVIAGQQAGFLGGPLYTLYKILGTIRLSVTLAQELRRTVVPIFWLASDDHDLTEINRVRCMTSDGTVETLRFDVPDAAQAAEAIPITSAIRDATAHALACLGDRRDALRNLFTPGEGDTYSRWHARIWSRLFGDHGLVLVEPHVLRSLAGPLLSSALAHHEEIRARLRTTASSLARHGYPVTLDVETVGRPFLIDGHGHRTRISDPEAHVRQALDSPGRYSPDVALRPLVQDGLLPVVASLLGPGEFAYHGMLRPLYELFEIPQPMAIPRPGYTLLSTEDDALLHRLSISPEEALAPDFNPQPRFELAFPKDLQRAFDQAAGRLSSALMPLRSSVADLDPGLEARWNQVHDRSLKEVEQLRERALRAALAKNQLSPRRIRGILHSLRPGGELQERGLSFVHFAARFGIEWIHRLPGGSDPGQFSHWYVPIEVE